MHIFCQWRNRRRPDKALAPPSGIAESGLPILPDGAALIRPTMLSRRPDKAPAPPSGVAESERPIPPDGAALIRPTLLNSRQQKASPWAGFSESVGDRGLLATAWLALRAVARATFSRYARVEPLAPGGSHPR